MPSDRRIKIRGSVLEGDVILGVPSLVSFTHVISIVFYNNEEMLAEHVVDKSSMTGTLTFSASETGHEYTLFNEPSIVLGTTDYERPTAFGSYSNFKMQMSGVSGATHYTICIASAGGV